MNLRHSAPKADALPGCATLRKKRTYYIIKLTDIANGTYGKLRFRRNRVKSALPCNWLPNHYKTRLTTSKTRPTTSKKPTNYLIKITLLIKFLTTTLYVIYTLSTCYLHVIYIKRLIMLITYTKYYLSLPYTASFQSYIFWLLSPLFF